MAQTSPLDVPEIRLMFGKYLDHPDQARCLRVSRQWHCTFLPLVWDTVELWGRDSLFLYCEKVLHPYQDAIDQSRDLVRTLAISDSTLTPFQHTFPALQKLSILLLHNTAREDLIEFLRRNPTVVQLKLEARPRKSARHPLRGDGCTNVPNNLWKVVLALPDLKRLELIKVRISLVESSGLWQSWSTNLESLYLSETSIDYNLGSLQFSRVRYLRLLDSEGFLNATHELDMIEKCPRLEHLEWRLFFNMALDNVTKAFASRLEAGTWPHLHTLYLKNSTVEDDDLASIVGAAKHVRIMSFSYTPFGDQAFKALRLHFEKVTALGLKCHKVTSAMLREVLCSCPLLETLTGLKIDAEEAIKDNPWVCLPLRYLSVEIVICSRSREARTMIDDRLEAMPHLQDRDIFYVLK